MLHQNQFHIFLDIVRNVAEVLLFLMGDQELEGDLLLLLLRIPGEGDEQKSLRDGISFRFVKVPHRTPLDGKLGNIIRKRGLLSTKAEEFFEGKPGFR
jgi:hypothetical protein